MIMKEKIKYTALVILNYNNYEDTLNCIYSVEKYNTSPIKIIVIDNGSRREGTVDAIDKKLSEKYQNHYVRVNDKSSPRTLPYMTFVVSETNDGYAQGNNKGLRFAYHDDEINRIMILNNDVLFVEDIIGKLIKYQDELPNCAIISPILYKKGLKEIDLTCARLNPTCWEIILFHLFSNKNIFGFKNRMDQRTFLLLSRSYENKSLIEVELPSGSCMLFKRELMDEITIFDPNTFLYSEENILFKQIASIGKKNYVVCQLKCIHFGASSTSHRANSFIALTGMKSADYYLKTYESMTIFQRIVWILAKAIFTLKFKTIRR